MVFSRGCERLREGTSSKLRSPHVPSRTLPLLGTRWLWWVGRCWIKLGEFSEDGGYVWWIYASELYYGVY